MFKNCLFCDKEFEAHARDHNRGRAVYCSRSCSSRHAQSRKTKPIPNAECALCGLPIYKAPSKLKVSKSGLVFCKRACKDEAQKTMKEIQPSHYGTGKTSTVRIYRAIAFTAHPHKCDACGWDEIIDVLVVHHKDRNRRNNEADNLQILCPTCHAAHHYQEKTGCWARTQTADLS